MARILITADLHVEDTADPEYRWRIFDFLSKQVQHRDIDELFILGDLTEEKDKHSSRLVNRLIDELRSLAAKVPVTILKGNHDYTDADTPFFQYLDGIPGIRFIKSAALDDYRDLPVYWLPHTRDASYWAELRKLPAWANEPSLVLVHQCFMGARTPDGRKLGGINPNVFAKLNAESVVLGGDIHDGQQVGRVQYIGAPAAHRFGDFPYPARPRVAIFDTTTRQLDWYDVPFMRKAKITVGSIEELKASEAFSEGDRVRVIYRLAREDYPEWERIRDEIASAVKAKRAVLAASPQIAPLDALEAKPDQKAQRLTGSLQDTLRAYGKARGLSDAEVATGLSFLELA